MHVKAGLILRLGKLPYINCRALSNGSIQGAYRRLHKMNTPSAPIFKAQLLHVEDGAKRKEFRTPNLPTRRFQRHHLLLHVSRSVKIGTTGDASYATSPRATSPTLPMSRTRFLLDARRARYRVQVSAPTQYPRRPSLQSTFTSTSTSPVLYA